MLWTTPQSTRRDDPHAARRTPTTVTVGALLFALDAQYTLIKLF